MRSLIIIANNLRSIHNVGSVFRTAEGLGVDKLYLTGYTPYPRLKSDSRLPHEINKLDKAISKVSLGAEKNLEFDYRENILTLINEYRERGYRIVALEQAKNSVNILTYQPKDKTILIIGNEVEGIDKEVLDSSDDILEIPMRGKKESFNVVQAMAMATFYLINQQLTK